MGTKVLNETESMILMNLLIYEKLPEEEKKKEKAFHDKMTQIGETDFLIQVIKKRIEVLKLPIKFTVPALIAMTILSHVPGGMMVILIECLNRFENRTVTVNDVCHLFPMGFYDESELETKIDEIKMKKGKWDYIY